MAASDDFMQIRGLNFIESNSKEDLEEKRQMKR